MNKRIINILLLNNFPGVKINRIYYDKSGELKYQTNYYKISLKDRTRIQFAAINMREIRKVTELETSEGVLMVFYPKKEEA